MFRKKLAQMSTSLIALIAVLCVYSMVALAAPRDVTGEITVNGQVSVNGQMVVSGSSIASGSTIVTGANSSAIVSLGVNGRIEILNDSSLTLNYTENSITGRLSSGAIRVSNAAVIGTTFTTRNATVIADIEQANSFLIDVGCGDEDKCATTRVETYSGLVSLKNATTDKQIAAGTDATIGDPTQTGCKPCMRPGGVPLNVSKRLWLLALLAIIPLALLLNDKDIDNNPTPIPTPTPVSPI